MICVPDLAKKLNMNIAIELTKKNIYFCVIQKANIRNFIYKYLIYAFDTVRKKNSHYLSYFN